jgi:hypothetical protein
MTRWTLTLAYTQNTLLTRFFELLFLLDATWAISIESLWVVESLIIRNMTWREIKSLERLGFSRIKGCL